MITNLDVAQRIAHYRELIRGTSTNYNLEDLGVFVVTGARVYDDAKVSQPDCSVSQIGLFEGRFGDVLERVVQDNKFYADGRFRPALGAEQVGRVCKEKREVIPVPESPFVTNLL